MKVQSPCTNKTTRSFKVMGGRLIISGCSGLSCHSGQKDSMKETWRTEAAFSDIFYFISSSFIVQIEYLLTPIYQLYFKV